MLGFSNLSDVYDDEKKKFIGTKAVNAEWLPSEVDLKQMCDYRNRVIGLANCKVHEWNRKIPGEPEGSESEASDTTEYESDGDANNCFRLALGYLTSEHFFSIMKMSKSGKVDQQINY